MTKKIEMKMIKSIMEVVAFLLISAGYILQAIYKYFLPKRFQKPPKDLKGEIALITGGGGGLGRLLAMRLAKLGVTVVLWDVNINGVEETVELVKGIGGIAYGYKCDLCNKDDVYKVAKITQTEIGDISILINNAGVVSGQTLLNTPDHLIKRTFDVNIIAHFWTVKAFLPKMIKKSHGHIITVASLAGHAGINKLVDYCASKFAAVGFDEALRVELEAQGVRGVKTTVVCPYFIQATGMFGTVDSRFLPRLNPNDVADRILEGIVHEQTIVMVPEGMRFGLILKSMVPWKVVSMFLRGLVPDAAPHSAPQSEKEEKENGILTANNPKIRTNSLTDSLSQLNHRLSPTGKNL